MKLTRFMPPYKQRRLAREMDAEFNSWVEDFLRSSEARLGTRTGSPPTATNSGTAPPGAPDAGEDSQQPGGLL